MGRRHALALFVAFASHCACFSVGDLAARITSPRVLPPQAYASTIESGEQLQPLEDHIVIDLQSAPSATVAGILLPTVFEDECDTFQGSSGSSIYQVEDGTGYRMVYGVNVAETENYNMGLRISSPYYTWIAEHLPQ